MNPHLENFKKEFIQSFDSFKHIVQTAEYTHHALKELKKFHTLITDFSQLQADLEAYNDEFDRLSDERYKQNAHMKKKLGIEE